MKLTAKAWLVLSVLIIPTIILLGLAGWTSHVIQQESSVTLPITGYDPRDPVYGHYFQFRIDTQRADFKKLPADVQNIANLNWKSYRFYVDEQDGPWLDAYFREHASEFTVTAKIHNQTLHIQDLLIQGRPYRDVMREKPDIKP